MNFECKTLLKTAISQSLRVLMEVENPILSERIVWSKQGPGHWQSDYVRKPDPVATVHALKDKLIPIGTPFAEAFLKSYPDYQGMIFLGGAGFNLRHDPAFLFSKVLLHLWEKRKTFDLRESEVDMTVNEFAKLVESSVVRLRFRASLIGFNWSGDHLQFPGFQIRRMDDEEISQIYGGPVIGFASNPMESGLHEFCIESEESAKLTFTQPGSDRFETSSVFDNAMIALRTFKEGAIDYGRIYVAPVTFCPVPIIGGYASVSSKSGFGIYHLGDSESQSLIEHAGSVLRLTSQPLRLACSRLADAETRSNAHDAILDAVIGMEAILLAAAPKEGELKFRFSLNYAWTHQCEQRAHAFAFAKNLYDLRSTIAHGGLLKPKGIKFEGRPVSIRTAAQLAKLALRRVIKHFLLDTEPRFTKREYWESACLGLRAETLAPAKTAADCT
jgi:hypothetical protein